jgi:hypothetical protein
LGRYSVYGYIEDRGNLTWWAMLIQMLANRYRAHLYGGNRPLWVAVQGPWMARPLYIHTYIHTYIRRYGGTEKTLKILL